VVHDPRPVAKAVQRLETLYGLPVTYEDPQYVHESEVADVSVAARSVVSRLLQEFDIPLSWRLLYDPGLHWYVLNIHAVTPANK